MSLQPCPEHVSAVTYNTLVYIHNRLPHLIGNEVLPNGSLHQDLQIDDPLITAKPFLCFSDELKFNVSPRPGYKKDFEENPGVASYPKSISWYGTPQ